jgi:hypothetical protein
MMMVEGGRAVPPASLDADVGMIGASPIPEPLSAYSERQGVPSRRLIIPYTH